MPRSGNRLRAHQYGKLGFCVKHAVGFAAKASGAPGLLEGSSQTTSANLLHHQSTRHSILKWPASTQQAADKVVGSGQLALMSPKSIRTYCEGQQTRLPKKTCHCRCAIFNRKFLALEVIPVVYVRTNMTSPKKRRHQMHDANFSAYCCSEVRWQSRNPPPS
jgi:hypothetical protein